MTEAQVREAVKKYREKLSHIYQAKRFNPDSKPIYSWEQLDHVLWMLDLTEHFLDNMKTEKVFRWLGFIQGVLWSEGMYTINEIKEHNQ